MNHAKAKRIAEKWSRPAAGNPTNGAVLGRAYLEVRRLAEELAAYMDTLNLPEDSGCTCDDCAAGRKLFEFREALKA